MHLRALKFQNFPWGGMPPDPPQIELLQPYHPSDASYGPAVQHRFSLIGAFWHTAVRAMHSSGTYQCPPLCSIHLC